MNNVTLELQEFVPLQKSRGRQKVLNKYKDKKKRHTQRGSSEPPGRVKQGNCMKCVACPWCRPTLSIRIDNKNIISIDLAENKKLYNCLF